MGIGFKELVVILLIVLVLFGAKRLRTIGADLGSAIKNFRKSVQEGEEESTSDTRTAETPVGGRVIEGEISSKPKDRVG